MSDFIPKLDLTLAKESDGQIQCVICGKTGKISELVSGQHGKDKIKEVQFRYIIYWIYFIAVC